MGLYSKAGRHRIAPTPPWQRRRWGIFLACLIALAGWGGYSPTVSKPERSQRPYADEPREVEPVLRLPAKGDLTDSPRQGVATTETPDGQSADTPLQPSAPLATGAADPGPTPRVYVHIRSAAQLEEARQLTARLRRRGYVFPKAAILVDKGPQQTQVRYFRPADAADAATLTALLKGWQRTDATTRYIRGYEHAAHVKPGHYEIWLSPATLD